MQLKGQRLIPATVEETWLALNNPHVLKACIQGCESLEEVGDGHFSALMAVRVGPVSARFKGSLRMTEIRPLRGYVLHFEGQGGVAGHGKGSADVQLQPRGNHTLLSYAAHAQVGGKLAQIGSRLVDAAAAKISEEFFSAFEGALASPAVADTPLETCEEPIATERDTRPALVLIAIIMLTLIAYIVLRQG